MTSRDTGDREVMGRGRKPTRVMPPLWAKQLDPSRVLH